MHSAEKQQLNSSQPAMVEKIQGWTFSLSPDSECDEDENADEAAIST